MSGTTTSSNSDALGSGVGLRGRLNRTGSLNRGDNAATRRSASGVQAGGALRTGTAVPQLRVFMDQVTVDRSDGLGEVLEDLRLPLLALSFGYGDQTVAASDFSDRVICKDAFGVGPRMRDREAEARARYLLESFGAVELDCLEHYGVAPDLHADYLVRVEGDRHSHCAFTAYAVPQLRKMGWRVLIDDDYPYQVIEPQGDWYASVDASEDKPDWFTVELGIEVDGQRLSLLPVLLDLIQESGTEGLESLLRSSTKCVGLAISDTHHVVVSKERLRALARVVVELYQGEGRDGFELQRSQAVALTALDEAFGAEGEQLQWEDPEALRDYGQALLGVDRRAVTEPPEVKATLRPYQREGLEWLQHMRSCEVGGVLADDMGLGKTLQTITHLALEKSEGRLDKPALVVTLTSLVGNWKREFQKFAPHMDVVMLHGPRRHALFDDLMGVDVAIISYPLLVRDLERLQGYEFHFLVLDEAHTIKNRRSRAHQAAKAVVAEHRLCLTGTPVENHLGELWSLFDFLNPGLLGNEQRFRNWYRQPIERFGDEERLQTLQQQVAPYILRRVKSDVAKDLPPKTELMRPVELSGKQRELYESLRVAAHAQVRNLIKSKGFAQSTIPILDALMKLRQICCDPRIVNMDAARFVRESAKYELLFEMLDTQLSQGHRVLVFSQFTSMLKLISEGLEQRGTGHLMLTGSSRDRQGLVDDFEGGKADIFLISLKAGGTGLNLTSADTVIHYDPWWNPQAQAQATDRAYRIGQKRPVFVYNLFVAGSVEERMLRLQQRKRNLANAILGASNDTSLLTEQDVDMLFAPLVDSQS